MRAGDLQHIVDLEKLDGTESPGVWQAYQTERCQVRGLASEGNRRYSCTLEMRWDSAKAVMNGVESLGKAFRMVWRNPLDGQVYELNVEGADFPTTKVWRNPVILRCAGLRRSA